MAEASRINDEVMLAAEGFIHEGVTELEVAEKITAEYLKHGCSGVSFPVETLTFSAGSVVSCVGSAVVCWGAVSSAPQAHIDRMMASRIKMLSILFIALYLLSYSFVAFFFFTMTRITAASKSTAPTPPMPA